MSKSHCASHLSLPLRSQSYPLHLDTVADYVLHGLSIVKSGSGMNKANLFCIVAAQKRAPDYIPSGETG